MTIDYERTRRALESAKRNPSPEAAVEAQVLVDLLEQHAAVTAKLDQVTARCDELRARINRLEGESSKATT